MVYLEVSSPREVGASRILRSSDPSIARHRPIVNGPHDISIGWEVRVVQASTAGSETLLMPPGWDT